MCNKDRITPILMNLHNFWSANPDLKFFQMIEAYKALHGIQGDGFHAKDDRLLKPVPKPPEHW